MDSTKPSQPTTATKAVTDSPFLGNVRSLKGILNDIRTSLNVQVIENIDVLAHLEIKRLNGGEDEVAFINHNLEALVRSPVRHITGRMSGLMKVLSQLETQAENLLNKTVYTGKDS